MARQSDPENRCAYSPPAHPDGILGGACEWTVENDVEDPKESWTDDTVVIEVQHSRISEKRKLYLDIREIVKIFNQKQHKLFV